MPRGLSTSRVKKPSKSSKKPTRIKLSSVQTLANKYARLRDTFGSGGAGCISCGKWFSYEELDGGHFIPTTVSSVRFDEANIHAQCRRCNRYLRGNIRLYFRALEKKLGRKRLDDLESRAGTKKWTQDELLTIKEYYKKKIKDIESGIPPTSDVESMDSMFKL